MTGRFAEDETSVDDDDERTDTLVDVPAKSEIRPVLRKKRRETPEDRLGDRIGDRYEITHVLGSGSAFEASDLKRSGARVAIKVLHEHLRSSHGHVARFEREVRATTAIAHSS